jgi:hypothetical protein
MGWSFTTHKDCLLHAIKRQQVVKLEIFISHPFDILPSLLPNVFLLGNLQVNYLSMI